MESAFGIIATALGILGAFAYIRDTYHKKTKPHRFAWFIFLVISIISFSGQLALGAEASLFFAGWFVCNNLIILSLALRKDGGFGGVTKLNLLGLTLALLGIVLWMLLSSPLLALISVLVAEIVGVTMIVVKSYNHPGSETLIMWALGIIASALNVMAVGSLDFGLLLFPVYLLLGNIAIVLAIITGRHKLTI